MAFAGLAAAALAGAIFLPASCGIEGAYFDRSVSAPRAVGNVVISQSGMCWVPDVLVGATLALAVCSAMLFVLGWRLRRRAAGR